MKRSYWEQMAATYGEEIFDVLHHDKKALIRGVIAAEASPEKTVIDIGCAIGKWLPVLAPVFKKVIAVDISANNLAIAAQLYPQYRNVDYVRANMSGKTGNYSGPKADFGICINAILTAVPRERRAFFASLSSCIKKGGRIVITVPSLESWMFSSVVQQEWGIDKKIFPPVNKGKEAVRMWNNIRQGHADIDNVPHKHYLREELQLLLSVNGFVLEDIQKIEYDWNTEFLRPPRWLKEPRPWDWMVVARKK